MRFWGEARAETHEILGPSSERRGDFAAELASLAAGSPIMGEILGEAIII